MDKDMILEHLRSKLEKNYADFTAEWLKQEPLALLENAEIMAATKKAYKELGGGSYSADLLEYLLRFENPLEVVRDVWVGENLYGVVDNEFSHMLWNIADKGDAEQCYALDENYAIEAVESPLTVRAFLNRHSDVHIQMATPGGFVALTPEKTQTLLNGESIQGHPGTAEYAMEILAEELLNQVVLEANVKGNTWFLLTDCSHEMEQEPPNMDLGVTMC